MHAFRFGAEKKTKPKTLEKVNHVHILNLSWIREYVISSHDGHKRCWILISGGQRNVHLQMWIHTRYRTGPCFVIDRMQLVIWDWMVFTFFVSSEAEWKSTNTELDHLWKCCISEARCHNFQKTSWNYYNKINTVWSYRSNTVLCFGNWFFHLSFFQKSLCLGLKYNPLSCYLSLNPPMQLILKSTELLYAISFTWSLVLHHR